MGQYLKRCGLIVAFMFAMIPMTHASTVSQLHGHYFGGEIGYHENSPFHAGFRFLTSFQLGKAGGAFFDVQPTFVIASGWSQYLRLEGGANFGVGSFGAGVHYSFVMVGVNFHLSLDAEPATLALGPTFVLPLSVNIYWKKMFFGMHWGVDMYFPINGGGSFTNPLYVRFIVAYKFK
ncbi:MAG: hypothetical protein ACRC9L_02170 [Brevinema sp.]